MSAASRLAVVTGGGSGIGAATAGALAGTGWQVVAVARSIRDPTDPLDGAAGTITTARCDVRDPAQVDELVTTVLDRYGRLDALVNAAGILRAAPIGAASLSDVRDQLETNLLGTILTVERAATALRAANGSIVNVSSTLAEHPSPGTSAYAASKGGVEAYTRSVALELAPTVRVNCVRLGLVRTAIHLAAGRSADESDEIFARGGARLPLGRVGTADEVASCVCYLLSDDAAWVTGSTFVIDGGRSLA